jgi:hypothetical protein
MSRHLLFSPLTILCFAAGATVLAQSPGAFGATASMTIPRVWHTATLLTNGKVLIAGGVQTVTEVFGSNPGYINLVTATAELYDPATGTFTPTGSMSMGRYLHAATLLADGRVLVSGGAIQSPQTQTTNTAEIYDPATGSFSLTTPMMYNHACQQALLLNSGQVLVAGGSDANGTGDNHPELFNPQTASFSSAGLMQGIGGENTCAGQAAAVLTDGKVLLVSESGTAQAYDPTTQTFTPTVGGVDGAYNDGLPTATLVADGTVLVAGGYSDSGIIKIASTFDEASGLFTRSGNMSTGYDASTATLLTDRSVLLAGTCAAGISPASDSDVYDPASRTFSHLSMATPRCWHTATLLNNGQVLVAGGFTMNQYVTTASAELYHPATVLPTPALFSLAGNGQGQGAIWNATTGQIASSQNPASAGEILSMYTTNLIEGGAIPPQAAVGGQLAEILYFGDAPGYPGYFQINFQVPAGITPGSSAPVVLTYLGRSSNAVSISVH